MKKKHKKSGGLKGAMIAGALGVVAGMLLAPESGKKLRKDIKKTSAHFYHSIIPQIKKMKNMGEKEYKSLVGKALGVYAKAQKLSEPEVKELRKGAERYWNQFRKHL